MARNIYYTIAIIIAVATPSLAHTLEKHPRYMDQNDSSQISTTSETPTKTTSTQPSTTTTAPPENVVTTCGGILEGTAGTIDYLFANRYPTYMHCVWTIRTNPQTLQIELTKEESYLPLGQDFITAGSLSAGGVLSDNAVMGLMTNNPEHVVMNGSVAIVAFGCQNPGSGRGFRLHFRAAGETQNTTTYGFDYSTGIAPSSISYPPLPGSYENNELSTFVMTNGYKWSSPYLRMNIETYDLENSAGCQFDGLLVYSIAPRGPIEQLARYCGTSNGTIAFPSVAIYSYLFVLYSDGSNTGRGFSAFWNTAPFPL